jgi:sterol desaturase/sphingolipid hydroxylase (fatty acid hydroxylase superfamily)
MAELDIFKTVLFVGGFLLFSCLQYFFPYAGNVKDYKQRTITNISLFLLNLVVTVVFVNIIIKYSSNNLTIEHSFIYYLAVFLVLDVALYLWHRLNHVLPFLWRFHQVHHLDNLLSTTTAFRFHPVEIFISPLFKIIFVWGLGMPLEIIVIHTAVVNFFSFYEHSNINLPKWAEKPVSLVFITPNIHKIHHHPSRKNTDSNYGTILTIWDKIFATFNNDQHTEGFGIKGVKPENNLKNLLVFPFQK